MLALNFDCNRIIVTVRNPFDVLISFSTFLHVWSHSKQIENRLEEEDPEWFDSFIKSGVMLMKEFQNDCLERIKNNKVPIMFLKFEELRKEPKEHLTDVFRFLLCKKDLSGSYVEHRIEEVLAMGHEATQAYKMKNHDGKFNAIDRFTPELQQHIKTELAPYCQFFDYFITDPNAKRPYQFIEPPVGWKPDESIGYYKDVTQDAIN